jgi:hypothetical protein
MKFKRKIVIKIKKEDLPKRRAGVIPSKKHKSKVRYNRKSKHKTKTSTDG